MAEPVMDRDDRSGDGAAAGSSDVTAVLPGGALVGILRCDPDGRILAANETIANWAAAGGPGAMVGRSLTDYLEGVTPCEQLDIREPATLNGELIEAGGARVPVRAEWRNTPSRKALDLWIVKDIEANLITRLTTLQAALTVTLGTVHDVNNVLTVLSGNLFLITDGVRDNPALYEQSRRVRNAAERGASLLRELLTFSKQSDTGDMPIKPGNHVKALEPLLQRTLGQGRTLKIETDQAHTAVVVSAAQLDSVLINLVINSRDATAKSGKVGIRVRDASVDARRAATLELRPGNYVCIEVRDNGAGIPRERQRQVMEPMVTTKRHGRGCGLGLTMVRRFARSHGGAIELRSAEGRGTLVRIWLPASDRDAETTANMTLPLTSLPAGTENILLISGDDGVRESLADILQNLGYSVATADSLESATDVNPASAPALIICERHADNTTAEKRALRSIARDENVRHLALLQAGVDPARAAPDADACLFRPIAVYDLAHTVRRVLEET